VSIEQVANSANITANMLSDIGSWASIVGLIVTFVTFALVWGIKNRFFFRSNVEDHKKNISDMSSELSSLLSNFTENKHDIDDLIARVDVELRVIESGAKKDLLADVKEARQKIKQYRKKSFFSSSNKYQTEATVREIKTSLSAIAAEFEYVKKSLMVGK